MPKKPPRVRKSRRQPLRDWARQVMRRRLADLDLGLERMERLPDADSIHESRIACRRSQAALRHLEPCFPGEEVRRLRAAIRKVLGLLGEARDLDITAANIGREAARPGSPLAPMVTRLKLRRCEKLRSLLPGARQLRRNLPGFLQRLAG